MTASPNTLPAEIARRLKARERREVMRPAGWREAAVLIPLFWHADKDEWYVLFTLRSNAVPTHKGQISFPGGGREPGDSSLLATALRETWEEIGVRPEDVEILGVADDVMSNSSCYVVTPFVGVIPHPYAFTLNPAEIDELIEVPLSFFRHPDHHRVEHWELRGKEVPVHFFDWNGYVIWGLTARVLTEFLTTIRDIQG